MSITRRVLSPTTPSKQKLALFAILLMTTLNAETLDESLSGFDDEPTITQKEKKVEKDEIMAGFDDEPVNSAKKESAKTVGFLGDFTGKVTEQATYSYSGDAPHDNISSLKTSLLLDYEHKFDNGFKVKTNAKAYYDAIYDIRGKEKYSDDEIDELQSEVELYDAYIEGSLADNLDMRLGRQVVVWGRSDTIRVTDVLNPLDNRRPGIVDIEDLRLPVAMAKLDYYIGDWRVTPIAVLEQRFTKNPPAGSAFNPSPISHSQDDDSKVTPALSIGGEFSGWDINFYGAEISKSKDEQVNMFGTALNVLSGSWLLKSELAYFDEDLKRTKGLLGLEYNGVSDTRISYDVAIEKQDKRDNSYQHAFRISSDFMNATLKANYLISLFGSKMDEGGFQRAWVKYDIADGVYANVGVVDYIGGTKRFDMVSDNDMAFVDVTYSF